MGDFGESTVGCVSQRGGMGEALEKVAHGSMNWEGSLAGCRWDD